MLLTDSPRFEIKRFVGGPLLTTCYALIVPGKESIIIDAPRDAWKGAIAAADERNAPVQLALATHGHWDHVTDMAKMRAMGYRTAGHPADSGLFANPMAGRAGLPFVIEPVRIDQRLADGDHLSIGGIDILILHTPGHTAGSVCLWIAGEEILFTGDTLLKGGAGYLERPESDSLALATSIRRLAEFPSATTLYPGHGAPTTIAEETWLEDAQDPDTLVRYWKAGQRRWKPPGGGINEEI
ncbi:MBL fold metallo-hydrolase [soil metagenome]